MKSSELLLLRDEDITMTECKICGQSFRVFERAVEHIEDCAKKNPEAVKEILGDF